MKKLYFFLYIIIFLCAGTAICLKIANGNSSNGVTADATMINRRMISIGENWADISTRHGELVAREDDFDYTVIGLDGTVYIMTREDMAQSVSSATTHYDIIRDIEVDGVILGRIIIHNPAVEKQKELNTVTAYVIAGLLSIMLLIIVIYFIYINYNVIRPFSKMKKFAVRVAAGDLDSPLEMDRNHVFGEFTEAFDIMREELKSSREREEAAVKSRKELVAELSHDIKTPVASIKAMADVMTLSAKDDMERETIAAINGKADQIDSLISNLFHATLEELEQLEVNVEEMSSKELIHMIREADYMKKVTVLDIKDAVIICDSLRINQVITNIISNSYKYAGTEISVSGRYENESELSNSIYYILEICDKGGGVPDSELDLIMDKFKRGSNAAGKDGTGLGLYISKYLMEKMDGGLVCSNTEGGFCVSVRLKMA